MEGKRDRYESKWCEGGEKEEELLRALERVKEVAMREEEGEYDINHLRRQLSTMSDRTGRGADNIGPGDIRALTRAGQEALVGVLKEIDKQLAWPWHLLISVVAIVKKPEKGDKSIHHLPVPYTNTTPTTTISV